MIRLIASVVLVLSVLLARRLAARRIVADAAILTEEQRRQLFYLRSAVSLILIVGLFSIWIGQLQNLLLSLTAVVVAIVIATKELLMCISGFVLRTTSGLFSVGDWIDCNGLRGEVIDHTLLTTTVLELDTPEHGYGYTGRRLTLPNSLFLSHPVRTDRRARQYVLHRFAITLEGPVDSDGARAWLQRHAEALCAPFMDEARRYNDSLDRQLGVDVAGPEPVVGVTTSDIGKPRFPVTLFCPMRRAAELESALTAGVLDAVRTGAVAGASSVSELESRNHE